MYHNDIDTYIYNPEYFCQYFGLVIHEHEGNSIQIIITHSNNAQLDGGSNSHVFSKISMFTYMCPLNFNVRILNGSKDTAKLIGLVIIKIPKTNIIITIMPNILYAPKSTKYNHSNST